jgi:hypothetical protein
MKLFYNKCCYTIKVIVRDRFDGRRAWTKENTRTRVSTTELYETLEQAQEWAQCHGFEPEDYKICRVIEEDAE